VPLLALGPLLRYVGETEATVWVETDQPCDVTILDRTEPTFHVEGHNYALIYIDGLEPGSATPYEVHLDGERVWPDPEHPQFPQSLIRTPKADTPHKMVWGSCRVSVPHEPPYSLKKDDDEAGREIDAAYAYALRMVKQDPSEWPHVMLWLGDQVYADEVSPRTRDFIRTRRDIAKPPYEEVADFEEYTHLYLDSWSDPTIRWLLSTVSSAMIFDDHDVHDDWNTSREWVREMREQHWWNERIVGGFMSYWLYQHIGNLSPRDLEDDELFQKVRRCHTPEEDAGPALREFAFRADRETDGTRWSYCRDIARTRLIVMDSRAGRVLEPGRRSMVDDEEWDFISEHAKGDFNHLIFASTLPILLPPALHYMEAWNEAVAEGAWGKGFWARIGEKLRQGLDLEHWAAFQDSFHRVIGLAEEVARGERGEVPGSVVFLSGDIHNAYLAELSFPNGSGPAAPVWQGVCSPIRNPLDGHERTMMKLSGSKPMLALTRFLAHRAGVKDCDASWKLVTDNTFDNQISTLDWEGKSAKLTLEKAVPGDPKHPRLECSFERRLA
jgi:PhoD-like phosphatase